MRKFISGLFILYFVLCIGKVNAQEVFEINDSSQQVENNLSGYLHITKEIDNKLGFNDILKLEFTKLQVKSISQSKHAHWLKAVVQNKTKSPAFLINVNNPVMDSLTFYLCNSSNAVIDSFLVSESFNFNQRQVQVPNYLYRINLLPDSVYYMYFRVSGVEDYYTQITVSPPQIAYEKGTDQNILLGIYSGVMLVMILYNLFIYFSVRDKSYVYYVFYILIVLITQLCSYGIPFKFMWPNFSWLQLRSLIIFPVFSGISGLLFMLVFIHVKSFSKYLYFIALALVGVYTVTLLIMLSGNLHLSYKFLQSNAIVVSLFMLFTAIYIFTKGSRPAGFFLVSWSFFLAGIILFILKDVGVIEHNSFTTYSMQIGSALEVVLLSFALGDKINTLKKEKEKSQAEALDALKENERIITEQNVLLEQKVKERTHELSETNEELSLTLKNLKDTQTQLVDQEKMASLGQLTAGIAHEINNPINFVTSNVSPLKRDINMLSELISSIEGIATSEHPVEDKLKAINKVKSDLDYDYLKGEIDFLLKGISEGASRTAEIVKGLRIFSRLDEDTIKKADIVEGIESTLVILNNQMDKIKVEKTFEGEKIIDCYPGKLNQVFLNLLSNGIYAIKAKFKGQEGGVISINTFTDANFIYIRFKDNGIGMDEEVQRKIFEPFFTTKPVGEGTGLGMSIVLKTIEMHRGGITLNSVVGEKTEFTIKLPIAVGN